VVLSCRRSEASRCRRSSFENSFVPRRPTERDSLARHRFRQPSPIRNDAPAWRAIAVYYGREEGQPPVLLVRRSGKVVCTDHHRKSELIA
jgi:hypothetical protein